MPTQCKRGRLHLTEEKYIRENTPRLSPAQIAEHLNRTEFTVKAWIIQHMGIPLDESPVERIQQIGLERELRASPEWDILQDELTQDELKYFKYRYGKLMNQFQDDVLATEETQIFMLIKYEILMNRNMKDRKRSVKDVERLEDMIDDIYNRYDNATEMPDKEKNLVLNLENQLLSARSASQNKSSEYVKLTEKHSSLMKELKGTRDQRVTEIQNSKQTFLDLIKEMQKQEVRDREGRHAELLRIATEKEKERLGEYHEFADKTLDQPLLTPENVIDD